MIFLKISFVLCCKSNTFLDINQNFFTFLRKKQRKRLRDLQRREGRFVRNVRTGDAVRAVSFRHNQAPFPTALTIKNYKLFGFSIL